MEKAKDSLFPRMLSVSTLFHLAACAAILWWGINHPVKYRAEQVIMVDLPTREYREPRPEPAPPRERQLPARPLPAPKSRPVAAPAPRVASQVPIAPIDAAREKEPAGVREMAVPPPAPAATMPARAERQERGEEQPGRPAPPLTERAPLRARGGDMEVRARYQAILKGMIEKFKEYPLFARKSRSEGICMVRCVLERDGSIRQVRVVRSSGHDLLDRSALRAVREVGQFPPVPAEIGGDNVHFDVPISFSLTEG